MGRKHRAAADLGDALFGTAAPREATAGTADHATRPAEILIADMELGDTRFEFIQYVEPPSTPFHGDPSSAGSAHVALVSDDIERDYRRLQAAGVRFHSPIRTVRDPGRPEWRWCYFRDPDNLCVELVQSGEDASHAGDTGGANGAGRAG